MTEFELNANVEDEQFTVEFESKDAAIATKQALNEAGHNAGVYVEHDYHDTE